jgi:hypothetical protein
MTAHPPKLLAALLCGGLAACGAALAQPRDGQGPGRLPPEAYATCQGKAEGAAVTITMPDGKSFAATCRTVPTASGQALAAMPDQPPPRPQNNN